jgi:hypothetical protein
VSEYAGQSAGACVEVVQREGLVCDGIDEEWEVRGQRVVWWEAQFVDVEIIW